jgi:hypothetical protein
VASDPGYVPVGRNIELGAGATASGKLFLGTGSGQFQGAVSDSSGIALSGATVHLVGSASTSAFDEAITTDTSGKYYSGNIPGGTYQLTAAAAGYNSLVVTASVGSGGTLTQNFSLTQAATTGGSVTGQVLKDDTTVSLVGATVAYGGGSTVTNSSGAYTLSNVPAGSLVSVTASLNGYVSSNTAVTVVSGATSTSTFALVPNCVAGTVNPSVTLCLPSANGSVLNPVHVLAKTTDSHPISLIQIWVDGKKVYEAKASSVDTHESMTIGTTHRVTVQAIDSINQIFKQSVTVTVQ